MREPSPNTSPIKNAICVDPAMRLRLTIAAFVAALVFAPSSVYAAAYEFEKFDASFVLDASGVISLTEDIQVNFQEPRHGLIWKVPVRYRTDTGDTRSIQLRVLSVTDESGTPIPFETSQSGDNLEVKIGDPDVEVTGPVHYRMESVLERAWNAFSDHDEFYWNVVGFNHEDLPASVSATVQPPEGVQIADITTRCFAGPLGNTDNTRCTSAESDGQLLFVAHEPMTIVIGMPKGVIATPTVFDRMLWFIKDNLVFGAPVLFFLLLLAVWWKNGRDAKGRHTIIAEYEPPQGMDPISMGTILDAVVHSRDVAAGIVGLAVKGHLTMAPVGEEKSPKNWTLTKKAGGKEPLNAIESALLAKLFASGDETSLSTTQGTMKKLFDDTAELTYASLAKENYFVRQPQRVRGFFYGVAMLFALVGWFLPLGIAGTISFGLIALEFAVFGRFMPKVTQKGALARDQARGFKLFLETAERDRLKWQEKEGMFEQYLPYAIVFGVVAQWAKTFAGSLTAAPSWYVGTHWNPMYFSSSMDSFSSTLGSAVRPAAASGKSGFSSGGGFSGGGFGGGGSSSW